MHAHCLGRRALYDAEPLSSGSEKLWMIALIIIGTSKNRWGSGWSTDKEYAWTYVQESQIIVRAPRCRDLKYLQRVQWISFVFPHVL
jgi:hypothetical protein